MKKTLIYSKINIELLLILILFFLAFIFRLNFLKTVDFSFSSDDGVYMSMTRYFLESNYNKLIHPHWAPLFPIFSAFAFKLFNNLEFAGRITSVFFGALMPLPIYYLAKNIWSKNVAFLSGFLIVISNIFVEISTESLTESIYMFWLWSAICLIFSGLIKRKSFFLFVGGLVLGIANLTKSEAIMVIPAVAFLFLISYIVKEIKNFFPKKTFFRLIFDYFKKLLLIILGFFIITFPYKYLVKLEYPNLGFFSKISAHWYLSSPFNLNPQKTSTWAQDIWSLETVDQDSEIYKDFTKYLKGDRLLGILDNTGKRIKILTKDYYRFYLGLPQLILIICGLILIAYKKRILFVQMLVFFSFFFLSVMFFLPSAQDRYLYFIIPLLYLLISVSSVSIAQTFFKKNIFLGLFFLASLMFVFYSKYIFGAKYLRTQTYTTFSLNERNVADYWLRNNDPGKRVLARHEGYTFHSRSMIIYTPFILNLSELVDYAKMWKANYIIATPNEVPNIVDYLYKDPKDYPGLKMVYNSGYGSVLYEVLY